jgi:hypothetical protein
MGDADQLRGFLPDQGEVVNSAITGTYHRTNKLPISSRISSLFGLKTPAIPASILALPYHRHLNSYPPQMSVQDMQIKSGIFPCEAIIVEAGKLRSLFPCRRLPVMPEVL